MKSSPSLSASLEDYLEAILKIIDSKKAVRAKDLADQLNVRAASVTGALKQLNDKGLINYAPYDTITLTDRGAVTAREILVKHQALKTFFSKILRVNDQEAETAACGMEHNLSPTIMERMVQFTAFLEECPRAGQDWLENFHRYCTQELRLDDCAACLTGRLGYIRHLQGKDRPGDYHLVPLATLKPGERGRIMSLGNQGAVKKRLTEMGITVGNIITMEQLAPMGDPMKLKVRGTNLMLRKNEAAKIMVEMLS